MWIKRAALPLINLKDSINLYKQALRPLLSHNEYQQALVKINAFEKEKGKMLHEKLLKHKEMTDVEAKNLLMDTTHGNWLDKMWLNVGYHQWRVPLLIHSNWWMLIKEPIKVLPHGPLGRLSLFVSAILHYKQLIDKQAIPQDKGLCMDQYTKLFAHRVPLPVQDKLIFPSSDYIVVLIKNQCFKVKVLERNEIIAPMQLHQQLLKCYDALINNRYPNIPLLTTMGRDEWATIYLQLKENSINKNSLNVIENALFSVCLDDSTGDGIEEQLKLIAHGVVGNNRWLDKSLNVILLSDGTIGINGEHSPCDALIPTFMAHAAWERESKTEWVKGAQCLTQPEHLPFVLNSTLAKTIEDAQIKAKALIQSSDIGVAIFKEFGKREIKALQVSPDTFIQLSFQLTFYRLHNFLPNCYETASTRQFDKGRTETCRTTSMASKEWAEAMTPSPFDKMKVNQLFRKAAEYHKSYIIRASNGMGFDRHFFGLKMMLNGEEMPEIFTDESWKKAMNFQLSTSQLGSRTHEFVQATGFGSAVPKGYGLSYFVSNDEIRVGIECKIQDETTEYSVKKFKEYWKQSMIDIKALLE